MKPNPEAKQKRKRKKTTNPKTSKWGIDACAVIKYAIYFGYFDISDRIFLALRCCPRLELYMYQ